MHDNLRLVPGLFISLVFLTQISWSFLLASRPVLLSAAVLSAASVLAVLPELGTPTTRGGRVAFTAMAGFYATILLGVHAGAGIWPLLSLTNGPLPSDTPLLASAVGFAWCAASMIVARRSLACAVVAAVCAAVMLATMIESLIRVAPGLPLFPAGGSVHFDLDHWDSHHDAFRLGYTLFGWSVPPVLLLGNRENTGRKRLIVWVILPVIIAASLAAVSTAGAIILYPKYHHMIEYAAALLGDEPATRFRICFVTASFIPASLLAGRIAWETAASVPRLRAVIPVVVMSSAGLLSTRDGTIDYLVYFGLCTAAVAIGIAVIARIRRRAAAPDIA